jgi:hypothetical protein
MEETRVVDGVPSVSQYEGFLNKVDEFRGIAPNDLDYARKIAALKAKRLAEKSVCARGSS